MKTHTTFVLFVLALSVAASGCGGGGSSSGTVAEITRSLSGSVTWPAGLGTITVQSITLVDLQTGQGYAQQPAATGTYDSTAGTYRIDNVPIGKPMAVLVNAQATRSVTVRLAAVVSQLIASSGVPATVTQDVSGATTIGAEAAAAWVKGGGATSAITVQVIANLVAAGAQLAATTSFDVASSLSAAAQQALTLTDNGANAPAGAEVSVSISPTTTSVETGGTATFTANVTGSTNTAVTWTVQEGSSGGTVAAGTYTAPSAAGTYHVVATSQADPTKSAAATVTVTAATGGERYHGTYSATAPALQIAHPPTTTDSGTMDIVITWTGDFNNTISGTVHSAQFGDLPVTSGYADLIGGQVRLNFTGATTHVHATFQGTLRPDRLSVYENYSAGITSPDSYWSYDVTDWKLQKQ